MMEIYKLIKFLLLEREKEDEEMRIVKLILMMMFLIKMMAD